MKKNIYLVVMFVLCGVLTGCIGKNNQHLEPQTNIPWILQDGIKDVDSQANSITIKNNLFIFGSASAESNSSYFIAKYTLNGKLIWRNYSNKYIGTIKSSKIYADNNENIYITGSITKDTGQTNNYFFAKYDSNGNLIWIKQNGGEKGVVVIARGITVDNNGNIYVTGETDIGLNNQSQIGNIDYFLAKYDSNGNLIWIKQNGGINEETIANSVISVDNAVYITGRTSADLAGHQDGDIDYFLAKYDSNGNLIWIKQRGEQWFLPDDRNAVGFSVNHDLIGNIYVVGGTNAALTDKQKQNDRIVDYFLAKYDSNGNLIWIKQNGGKDEQNVSLNSIDLYTGQSIAYDVAIDDNGNSYVCGGTGSVLSGTKMKGDIDYFIAVYDVNGNKKWIDQYGVASGESYARGIVLDKLLNFYVVGYTNKSLTNNPQIGRNDYFIMRSYKR